MEKATKKARYAPFLLYGCQLRIRVPSAYKGLPHHGFLRRNWCRHNGDFRRSYQFPGCVLCIATDKRADRNVLRDFGSCFRSFVFSFIRLRFLLPVGHRYSLFCAIFTTRTRAQFVLLPLLTFVKIIANFFSIARNRIRLSNIFYRYFRIKQSLKKFVYACLPINADTIDIMNQQKEKYT